MLLHIARHERTTWYDLQIIQLRVLQAGFSEQAADSLTFYRGRNFGVRKDNRVALLVVHEQSGCSVKMYGEAVE